MKRNIIVLASASFLTVLAAGFFFFLGFEITPSHVPAPASTISVETVDLAMASDIGQEVEAVIIRDPELYQMMRLQGASSSKEYSLLFHGNCAQAENLIAALTVVIRKYTPSPIHCRDPA